MRTGSIYIIKNTVNDKVYIGQTTMTVHERFMTHMKPSTVKSRGNYKLYNAVNKYGADKFYVETLEENVPLDMLNEREIELIAKYDSFNNGYNTTPGGDGRIINKVNDEDELLRLAKEGHSTIEIADVFGVNKATVIRTLHKLGFYYRPNQELICELAESGMKNKEISELLNCHPYTVSRALQRADKRKHRIPVKKRESFNYESMLKDYYSQMPIGELCAKYEITKTTFYRIKEDKKFATRPQIYANKIRYCN